MTEAHVEARRQQILGAANACFARNGFHQTTMQEICRQAELSPGAVYSYFESKEAIIEASCGANLEQHAELFQEAMRQGDTLTVLDQLVDTFFGMLAEPESDLELCHSVQIWGEVQRNPRLKEIVEGGRNSVLAYIEEIVRGAQERGEINAELDGPLRRPGPHVRARRSSATEGPGSRGGRVAIRRGFQSALRRRVLARREKKWSGTRVMRRTVPLPAMPEDKRTARACICRRL